MKRKYLRKYLRCVAIGRVSVPKDKVFAEKPEMHEMLQI